LAYINLTYGTREWREIALENQSKKAPTLAVICPRIEKYDAVGTF